MKDVLDALKRGDRRSGQQQLIAHFAQAAAGDPYAPLRERLAEQRAADRKHVWDSEFVQKARMLPVALTQALGKRAESLRKIASDRDLSAEAKGRKEVEVVAAADREVTALAAKALEWRRAIATAFPAVADIGIPQAKVGVFAAMKQALAGSPDMAILAAQSYVGREPELLWLAATDLQKRAAAEKWSDRQVEVVGVLSELAAPAWMRRHQLAQRVVDVLLAEAQLLSVSAIGTTEYDPALMAISSPALHAEEPGAFWTAVEARALLPEEVPA